MEIAKDQTLWDPKEAVINALKNERLAHAYLLNGPDSDYLKELAYWMAKLFFCDRRSSLGPCGSCSQCVSIDKGVCPDVHWVEPHGVLRLIKIPQIRKVQQEVALKAFGSKMKLIIIVGADAMNVQAANAFLKTLEEPPPDTVLLLIATQCEKVLPTILSRCQFLRCYLPQTGNEPMPEEGEDIQFKTVLSEFSQYNPQRMRMLIENGTWDRRSRIIEGFRKAMCSHGIRVMNTVDLLLLDIDTMQEQLEKDLKYDLSDNDQKMEAKATVEGVISHELKEILQTLLIFLKVTLINKAPHMWIRIEEMMEEALTMITRAANRRLVFESLFLNIHELCQKNINIQNLMVV
ncbi:MAG: DNA polymerase III subunit delta' [Chlamydiota bacterium]|nr:DNA polymerase III subunit delta' [Chlamydiota bacterium]